VTLPRQPAIHHPRPRQSQLHVDGGDQPSLAIGLLWMPEEERRTAWALFEETQHVLEVEASDVGSPQHIQVRRVGSGPPQLQYLRLIGPAGKRLTSTRTMVPRTMCRVLSAWCCIAHPRSGAHWSATARSSEPCSELRPVPARATPFGEGTAGGGSA
jgi:hypothetical protein